jgi:trimeric autotransporter adhesin
VLRTLCLAVPAAIGSTAAMAAPAFAVPISGVVFKDYNDDGAQSFALPQDDGVAGITVTAFAADGSVAAQGTTDDQGGYLLDVDQSVGKVRVQFSGLPDGYYSDRVSTASPPPQGAKSGTTVQFADVGSGNAVQNVNLGILRPSQYCQDNPELVVSCMYH